MELYLARRYLGMSVAEWDNLAWWVRRTYIEGIEAEELVTNEQQSSTPGEPGSSSGITDLSGAQVGESARLGHKEITIGPDGQIRRVGRPRA